MTGKNQIRNASTCTGLKSGDPTPCSLLNSTIQSLNVPFYELTVSVTPAKVLEMARDAGVSYMWTDARERRDLHCRQRTSARRRRASSTSSSASGSTRSPWRTTPTGMATFAAGGLRATAHFVVKVMDGEKIVYGETLPRPDQPEIMTPQAINDLTYALSQVGSAKVNIGWDTAGKTGTWEYNGAPTRTRMPGWSASPKRIAAAVWVGNAGDEQAIKDKSRGDHLGIRHSHQDLAEVHDRGHQGDEREEGEHEVQPAQFHRQREPRPVGAVADAGGAHRQVRSIANQPPIAGPTGGNGGLHPAEPR